MRPVYGVLLLALALCGLIYLADRFFRNRGHRATRPNWRDRIANGFIRLGAVWYGTRGIPDRIRERLNSRYEEWEGDIKDGRDVIEAVEQAASMCPNCHRSGYLNGLCNRCGYGYGYQPAYEAQVSAIYEPGQIPPTEAAGADDTDIIAAPRLRAGREPVYVPVAQRWITPEEVTPDAAERFVPGRPRADISVPRTGAGQPTELPGPGHFQPPDHVRQQVRALMAEYFPPPRIAIEAS